MVKKLRDAQASVGYTKVNENPLYNEVEELERVVSNISNWEKISFDEKRFTVDKMINIIKVFPGEIKIQWKL